MRSLNNYFQRRVHSVKTSSKLQKCIYPIVIELHNFAMAIPGQVNAWMGIFYFSQIAYLGQKLSLYLKERNIKKKFETLSAGQSYGEDV